MENIGDPAANMEKTDIDENPAANMENADIDENSAAIMGNINADENPEGNIENVDLENPAGNIDLQENPVANPENVVMENLQSNNTISDIGEDSIPDELNINVEHLSDNEKIYEIKSHLACRREQLSILYRLFNSILDFYDALRNCFEHVRDINSSTGACVYMLIKYDFLLPNARFERIKDSLLLIETQINHLDDLVDAQSVYFERVFRFQEQTLHYEVSKAYNAMVEITRELKETRVLLEDVITKAI